MQRGVGDGVGARGVVAAGVCAPQKVRQWKQKFPKTPLAQEAPTLQQAVGETERQSSLPSYDPFEDYLEILIQFGCVIDV